MSRMVKIFKNYQNKLEEKGIIDIPEFVQSILDADITKGKYSRFLLDCFISDKFRIEDLEGGLDSTIGEAIFLFHKYKGKLLKDMRSVYQYDSPGSLWNAVKEFDGGLSGKETKRSEQDKIYSETEFIYEDKKAGFKIITPLTEEAAKWWGKGTRWCTSSEKNNMFQHYAKDAPLLIFLMPSGEKLQLWKHENDIQFMDESDNTIELNYIEKNWNVLKKICIGLNDLNYIPEKYRTRRICMIAIEQNGEALKSVPEELKDYNLCLEAVKQNGNALLYVPKELIDYTMCLEAVKKDGNSLEHVPKELIDYNLCLETVKQNGEALCLVSKELKDYKLCLEAIKRNKIALYYVPEELIDYNMCSEAVKQNGNALLYVPKELKDYNLCLEAIKQDGYALLHVPEKFKTKKLCSLVVQKNIFFLSTIPEKYRTNDLCKKKIKEDGLILEHVPEKFKTKKICTFAIKQNGYALKYTPENLKTKEICHLAFKNNMYSIYYIPRKLITNEMIGDFECFIKENSYELSVFKKYINDFNF